MDTLLPYRGVMNRTYKTVFNRALGVQQVTSELERGMRSASHPA